MLHIPLESLTEENLNALIRDQTEESLRLEFKRELNLDDSKQRAEAAKDVSAMANAAGGRILYGIDEDDPGDGRAVASSITPLRKGGLEDRLRDILHTSIHPRLRYRSRKIDIAGGGFVLVVEVETSFGFDLHMIEAYNEKRFYKRGEKSAVKMSEPEVREAYLRIASARARVEERLEAEIQEELSFRSHAECSMIVAPWFGRFDLFDPRTTGRHIGREVCELELCGERFRNPLLSLAPFSGGMRTGSSHGHGAEEAYLDVAIRRTGVVHASLISVKNVRSSEVYVSVDESLILILSTLHIARCALERSGYWGPVTVQHRLHMDTSWTISIPEWMNPSGFREVDAGDLLQMVPEVHVNDLSDRAEWIAAELLDQLCHAFQIYSCPLFEKASLLREHRIRLVRELPKPHRLLT